ncbi:hypothetical protein ZWY2020_022470 [Hordeum vulgare]|nr:hypothetical protein ZWY2020_022470 [Hordeum vulgare]
MHARPSVRPRGAECARSPRGTLQGARFRRLWCDAGGGRRGEGNGGRTKEEDGGGMQVGWTIGHGSFAKVKFAVGADRRPVAMKVLDKATILNHRIFCSSSLPLPPLTHPPSVLPTSTNPNQTPQMGDMDDMEDFEGFGDEDDDGDEDDMEEPVTKKPKRSDSDSSSKIGRKSRKVITEVEEDEDRGSRQRTRM